MNRKITLVFALFILTGILVISTRVEKAKAVTRNFTLYGSSTQGWGFSPSSIASPGPAISVDQGDLVNLTLVSQDGFSHQFLVDYDGDGAFDSGEPLSSFFSNTIVFQFTANTNGTFTYYCTVHPLVMRGGFTVVPEFSPTAVMAAFIIVTLLVSIALRKAKTLNSAIMNRQREEPTIR